MDVLFTGDIPKDYHYAIFNNGYIDLYNTPNFDDRQYYNRYRVFTNCGGFYYNYGTTYMSSSTIATDIIVTDNFCYRNDFDSIVVMVFAFVIFGVFLFNIMTSSVRKGGVLGGLL